MTSKQVDHIHYPGATSTVFGMSLLTTICMDFAMPPLPLTQLLCALWKARGIVYVVKFRCIEEKSGSTQGSDDSKT